MNIYYIFVLIFTYLNLFYLAIQFSFYVKPEKCINTCSAKSDTFRLSLPLTLKKKQTSTSTAYNRNHSSKYNKLTQLFTTDY